MTKKLSECPYCKRPSDGLGINHVGGCTGLQNIVLNRLQYDGLKEEIERLQKREKDLMDVIDSRDRALGFVPLDEVKAHEPLQGETFPENGK